MHLASGAAFASIEVEPGQQVYLGNVDIKVAFYAMELPEKLLKCFGLPHDVRAGGVGATHLAGVKVRPDTRIVPVFCAIWAGHIRWQFAKRCWKDSHDTSTVLLPKMP